MVDFAREVLPVSLEDEMRQSYLDYAMSVIVGRALPDARDGLKPVHRRVLYAMSQLGNDWNKPYVKSAKVVGETIGNYHPHGDAAVYDTVVRMAQRFSMRYCLVDGQGNFGSIDGDAPAAMRYTEVRMARIAHEMLADIDKDTVDFLPTYDESSVEPSVLPARLPNLLANGADGIAVGMATKIPPHNLSELINGCVALIDDPSLTIEGLMEHIPGPDFPTAGIINGAAGIREAYATGRGRILIRARTHVEDLEGGQRQAIVATELPYQVNKARLLAKIAELVKEKRLEGIADLRDESDKDGLRAVIELRRGESADVALNNLYQHTELETVFGINMVALVDGQPRLLNLRQLLDAFLRHRREVVTRRSLFELARARKQAHIQEGLAVALANIDEIIALIRAAPDPASARAGLVARAWEPGSVVPLLQRAGAEASRPDDLAPEYGLHDDGYHLSEAQAQAILDLRLHRLTGLEQDKIAGDYQALLDQISRLLEILSDPDRLMAVIRDELLDIKTRFGDDRVTEIIARGSALSLEDLITPEQVVVTLSHWGYAKAQPLSAYASQQRGGRGKTATAFKEDDFVDRLFVANTHDTLLCFSSLGKAYWLKVYELPVAGRTARGKPIVNLLPLESGERISAVLPIKNFGTDEFIFFATRGGTVKKTPLVDFSRPRTSGIIAIDLRADDSLVDVALTDGARDIMLFSSAGKVIRFNEADVRAMGRAAAGVRGIRLEADQRVIALIIVRDGHVLTATERGYGKRTPVSDYPLRGRGGLGVIASQPSERNGALVGAVLVEEGDEVMLITNGGTLVRTAAEGISVMSRNTQGVRLIRLTGDERLAQVARVEPEDAPADDVALAPDIPPGEPAGDADIAPGASDPDGELEP